MAQRTDGSGATDDIYARFLCDDAGVTIGDDVKRDIEQRLACVQANVQESDGVPLKLSEQQLNTMRLYLARELAPACPHMAGGVIASGNEYNKLLLFVLLMLGNPVKTLIVCERWAMNAWVAFINVTCPQLAKKAVVHAWTPRDATAEITEDIVIVTYTCLREKGVEPELPAFLKLQEPWGRVIIDEADDRLKHSCKKSYHRLKLLQANHKWAAFTRQTVDTVEDVHSICAWLDGPQPSEADLRNLLPQPPIDAFYQVS